MLTVSPRCCAGLVVMLGCVSSSFAQHGDTAVMKVEADKTQGFSWPYLLYVPAKIRDAKEKTHTVLVVPNNTGSPSDDFAAHEKGARRSAGQAALLADQIGVVVLVPVFPRPKKDWRIYTHALDRDAMLTPKEDLRRPDLQLVAMLDHASARLGGEGVSVDRRVLLLGFSASGMFVNRFTFLHPDRVKAAAIGSPGGWPIAPVEKVNGSALRYPVGVADLESVAGKPLDLAALARVPLFVYMGDQDVNDSVVMRDSYEGEDEKLIGSLFGTTPVARWPHAEKLYREHLPRTTFKLYPGVGHKITPEMMKDLGDFLRRHAR
jgi:dienelactone hydrolase